MAAADNEYIVVNEGNIPALATISGKTPGEALANSDPGLDLPSRVTLVSLVGNYVVVPPVEEGTEVVQRVSPPAEEPAAPTE